MWSSRAPRAKKRFHMMLRDNILCLLKATSVGKRNSSPAYKCSLSMGLCMPFWIYSALHHGVYSLLPHLALASKLWLNGFLIYRAYLSDPCCTTDSGAASAARHQPSSTVKAAYTKRSDNNKAENSSGLNSILRVPSCHIERLYALRGLCGRIWLLIATIQLFANRVSYTHRYTVHNWKSSEWRNAWPQLLDDARLILEASDVLLSGPTKADGRITPPLIDKKEGVFVNGVADDSHEPLVIFGKDRAGSVKTNRKPYDLAVACVLLRAYILAPTCVKLR